MPRYCFTGGTRLAAARGDIPVEDLVEGESIVTLVGSERVLRPVAWIGRRHLDLLADPEPELSAPLRICRDALEKGVPSRDVLLSPDHRILIDGKLIPVRLLANGMTISHERHTSSVDYFHIELEAHSILLAEGMPAESFLDELNDRSFFSNSDGPVSLQANFNGVIRPVATALACAPLAMTAAEAEPAWRSLADRARALGFVAPRWDTTSDADLSLIADGTRLRPLVQQPNRCVFVLPAATASIRLASRASIPFDLDQHTGGLAPPRRWRHQGRVSHRRGAGRDPGRPPVPDPRLARRRNGWQHHLALDQWRRPPAAADADRRRGRDDRDPSRVPGNLCATGTRLRGNAPDRLTQVLPQCERKRVGHAPALFLSSPALPAQPSTATEGQRLTRPPPLPGPPLPFAPGPSGQSSAAPAGHTPPARGCGAAHPETRCPPPTRAA